MEYAQRLTVTF